MQKQYIDNIIGRVSESLEKQQELADQEMLDARSMSEALFEVRECIAGMINGAVTSAMADFYESQDSDLDLLRANTSAAALLKEDQSDYTANPNPSNAGRMSIMVDQAMQVLIDGRK